MRVVCFCPWIVTSSPGFRRIVRFEENRPKKIAPIDFGVTVLNELKALL